MHDVAVEINAWQRQVRCLVGASTAGVMALVRLFSNIELVGECRRL